MKTLLHILDNRSYKLIWRMSIFFVIFITMAIFIIKEIYILEIFYILPILLASWYGSRKSGLILTISIYLLLTILKFSILNCADIKTIFIENTAFLIVGISLSIIVTNFRKVHHFESLAADTDHLTGINNSRKFHSELEKELVRSSRYNHKFSLAYIDIDNFKNINDSFGHHEGDRLLLEVANSIIENSRSIDTVARLGGDEFAILFPETHLKEAKLAYDKLIGRLHQRMVEFDWPVTFSAGLVTFETLPDDIDEAINIADDLMYSVKSSEKAKVAYKVWRA